ncbi:MAG: dephospho-CoA kinase [Deltaproteobacteria bacterium]|nr:dephospho-CoA kinase [Deltaproteobacteria bacterium]
MLVIGLVGGIGSGKSVASAILAELGAAVLNADLVGHEVYEPGKPGFDAIVAEFGGDVVGADGRIDRKTLGPMVFADGAKLERLNAIVHPLIRAELERRIAQARAAGEVRVVVVEAAILLEAGWRSLVDQVWVISARRDDVVERLAAQRGMGASETDARIAKQMTDAERRSAADVVIENLGTIDDLRARLAGLWQAVVPR